jgi:hypothetical protein
MPNPSVRAALLALAACAALVPVGCGPSAEVDSYTVAKDDAPGEYRLLGLMVPADNPEWFFKYNGPADTVSQHEAAFDKLAATVALVNGTPDFAAPEGWTRAPGRDGGFVRVFATVVTADGKQEITITQSGGGVATNLDRWVGMIGQKPEGDTVAKYTKVIDGKGVKVRRVDLRGPKNPATNRGGMGGGGAGARPAMPDDDIHGALNAGGPKPGGPKPPGGGASALTTGEYRILGAMFPADEPQWFVKLTGSAAGLELHVAGFDQLLGSFSFPAGAAPKFDAPPGWTVGPGRAGIVTATLRTPDGKFEVTITSSIGGVFPNLRRWAVEQLGNGSFTQDDVPKITKKVDAKGAQGLRVDVRGPNNPAGKSGPFMGK